MLWVNFTARTFTNVWLLTWKLNPEENIKIYKKTLGLHIFHIHEFSIILDLNKQTPSLNSDPDMNFTPALWHKPNFPVLILLDAGVWNLDVHIPNI